MLVTSANRRSHPRSQTINAVYDNITNCLCLGFGAEISNLAMAKTESKDVLKAKFFKRND